MEVKRWELMPHVYLTYLPARKFKTGVLSAQFITPLDKETASYNALLPAVLHRGTMRCPDMEQLAAAMDRLYGAQISPTIRKRGETQCLGFVASFIDDRFVSRNEPRLEPAAELLGELLRQVIAALFWSGGADGATALVAIAFVVVASIVMLTEKSAFSQWGANAHVGSGDGTGEDPVAHVRTRIDDLSQAYQLTQREIEVLHLMAEGKTNYGIAQDMFIAESTVKVHVQHIYQKLDVHSRKELARLLGMPDANGS